MFSKFNENPQLPELPAYTGKEQRFVTFQNKECRVFDEDQKTNASEVTVEEEELFKIMKRERGGSSRNYGSSYYWVEYKGESVRVFYPNQVTAGSSTNLETKCFKEMHIFYRTGKGEALLDAKRLLEKKERKKKNQELLEKLQKHGKILIIAVIGGAVVLGLGKGIFDEYTDYQEAQVVDLSSVRLEFRGLFNEKGELDFSEISKILSDGDTIGGSLMSVLKEGFKERGVEDQGSILMLHSLIQQRVINELKNNEINSRSIPKGSIVTLKGNEIIISVVGKNSVKIILEKRLFDLEVAILEK